MKRVKFVSGFNAKMALVACAVAGFTLTGCEKEDFNVEVPNIEIPSVPEVVIPPSPEFPQEDGVAYLVLSATGTDGAVLADVTYTVDGTELDPGVTTLQVQQNTTVTVSAACAGFYTTTQNVVVPAVPKNQVLTVPVHIVLEPVDVPDDYVDATFDDSEAQPGEDEEAFQNVANPEGGPFEPGVTYTAPVKVPDSTPYITEEQKQELYAAVDALTGPVVDANSRSAETDLADAKVLLKAKIRNYQSTATTNSVITVAFSVTTPASSVRMQVTTPTMIVKITLSVEVNGQTYAVEGNCTKAGASEITPVAEGVDISHSHDHGNNPNAGGGTGE